MSGDGLNEAAHFRQDLDRCVAPEGRLQELIISHPLLNEREHIIRRLLDTQTPAVFFALVQESRRKTLAARLTCHNAPLIVANQSRYVCVCCRVQASRLARVAYVKE